MNNITIDDLLNLIKDYKLEHIETIRKAYEYADYLHAGQTRQSGEPYIIHPLNVAYILCEMSGNHADVDTICAALLHDTLEDCKVTKKDIEVMFNSDVANLVDGVTKISRMNFSSKAEQNLANTRKIINGITSDVRIIIIKLADRLHNMRTLDYKSPFKQKENAVETMEIFIPLAYYIGEYRIKSELEDLAFKYIYPEDYKRLFDQMHLYYEDSEPCLNEMYQKIDTILGDNLIPHEIKIRMKNIYGIFKRMKEGQKLSDIHDVLALKIMVDEVNNCYIGLGLIHSLYKPVPGRIKDYICSPKTNKYQSLHTTVFGEDDKIVQTQIRTFEMDEVASFGLAALWNLNMGNPRDKMQEELKRQSQIYRSLGDFNIMFKDNEEFVTEVKSDLFSDKVYIYTSKGDVIEMPKGSTIIDLAYRIHTDIGNTLIGAMVNEEYENVNYVLKNKDRVFLKTDEHSSIDRTTWDEIAKTSYAIKKIKEYKRKLK